jgi:hypothetical protein
VSEARRIKGRRAVAGAGIVLVAGAGMLVAVAAAAEQHAPKPGVAQTGSNCPAAGVLTRRPGRKLEIAGVRSQLMPAGVPAWQVGKLLVNDNGDDLAGWPRLTAYGVAGTMTHANGVLDLSTSGANHDGYSIISPNSYTSGIFEARIYFPRASDGEIADWPALWLSSAWSGAVTWPDGGEMDLAEGISGDLSVTYHYAVDGTMEATLRVPVTSAPGWHVVTGVWSTGQWDVYYDGNLVQTISGKYVVSDPMNIIVSAYAGRYGNLPGQPSTVRVSYVRIWSLSDCEVDRLSEPQAVAAATCACG